MATKWINRRYYRSKNILLSLKDSVFMTGSEGRLSLIDESLLSSNDGRKIRESEAENEAIKKLLSLFRGLETRKNVLESLKNLSWKGQEESRSMASEFVRCQGVPRLLSIIFSGDCDHEIRLAALRVLNSLCAREEEVSFLLGDSQEVIIFAFLALADDVLYNESRKLIESVLMSKATINLCSIPHFRKTLAKLEGKKLNNFCKILAATISDLETAKEGKSPFLSAQRRLKPSSDILSVKDINQELILSVPGFLEKLVNSATQLPYNPRFSTHSSEIDHWIRLIDDVISDELGRAALPSTSTEPFNLMIGRDLLDRVEAFYVLTLLLNGKHRKRAQKELSELKLIPKLSDLFDNFIWRFNSARRRACLFGHSSECECSPEVAVKIQFFRLVYDFCDNNECKRLLLSPYEWDELKRIRGLESSVQDLDLNEVPVIPELMCKGTSGLLTKMVEVLKKEQTNSTYRFWLCRAVESYVIGKVSYADQVFLLRRGLLQHVTASLINTDRRQKEIIQSSFDLLGELIKFNIDACRQMDAILTTEAKLKKAMIIVHEKLVDSNMFIRAMVLASDYFINSQDPQAKAFANKSRLMSLFRDLDKHTNYVLKLTRKLRVNTLTQDNISCLNTSLIIMMLNHRNNKLDVFLSSLSLKCQKGTLNRRPNFSFLTNLRNLLHFWQEYYLNKDKDCTQLEKTSRIPFEFWKNTVDCLVSSDDNSTLSLLHYHNKYSV